MQIIHSMRIKNESGAPLQTRHLRWLARDVPGRRRYLSTAASLRLSSSWLALVDDVTSLCRPERCPSTVLSPVPSGRARSRPVPRGRRSQTGRRWSGGFSTATAASLSAGIAQRFRIHEQNKFESLERINSIRKTNVNFDSWTYVKLHNRNVRHWPFLFLLCQTRGDPYRYKWIEWSQTQRILYKTMSGSAFLMYMNLSCRYYSVFWSLFLMIFFSDYLFLMSRWMTITICHSAAHEISETYVLFLSLIYLPLYGQ